MIRFTLLEIVAEMPDDYQAIVFNQLPTVGARAAVVAALDKLRNDNPVEYYRIRSIFTRGHERARIDSDRMSF